ncbi:MAG: Phosphoserine phosphatase RsbU [Bacteroidota bacterium]|jgi:sigma-B regulation protein RsbU (phosphoserine phosphatase)
MGESNLKDKIKLRDDKLQSLLEITQAINGNLSIEELVEHYRLSLSFQLHIPQILLFIHDQSWQCLVGHGFNEIEPWKQHIANLHDQAVLEITTVEKENSHVVIIPIEKNNTAVAYVILGDGNEENMTISPSLKHMKFVQTLTSILVVAIQNKKYIEQSIAQAAMARELHLAAEMQSYLLPKNLPSTPQIQVEAFYNAHGEVGGDYYDFFYINPTDWITCIADVSGKGLSAAFLMSNVQAHVRSLFQNTTIELAEAVNRLNTIVNENAQGEKFVTFFIARFFAETNQMEYINCGHNPAFLKNHDNGAHQWLSAQIPGLGMIDRFPNFESKWVSFLPQDELICYTDGLVEIENNSNLQFGEEGILQSINDNASSSIQLLMDAVKNFKGDMPYVDDIALVSVRRR